MGLFLAIFITIIFVGFSYIISGKDLLAPSFVIFAIFLLSLVFNVLNYSKWDVDIGSTYILVLFLGFFSTIFGEVSGKTIVNRITKKNVVSEVYDIIFSKKTVIAIIVGMLLFSIVYFKEAMRIALLYGNLNLQSPLQAIRNATYSVGSFADLDQGMPTWVLHGTLICKILAYIFMYIFAYKVVYESDRKKIKGKIIYLAPCLIYLIQSILSTSRSQILYFFAGAVYIYYLLYYCKNGKINQKTKKKFIKYGILVVIVFCVIFYLLGYLTKKSDNLTFVDNISIYIGGSQVSFNNWLEKYDGSRTNYFGEETLVGIRKIFFKLGLADSYKVRHLEFIQFGIYRGNVYTAFRRYISDFGYAGICIMQFISTFVLSVFYFSIKKKRKPSGTIILYGYIAYTFAMEAIDELFFSSIFEISNFYILIYGYLLYYFLIKRNVVWVVNQ